MKKKSPVNVLAMFAILRIVVASSQSWAASCTGFDALEFTKKSIDGYEIYQAKTGNFLINAGDTPPVITSLKTKTVCEAKVKIVSGDKGDVYRLKGIDRVIYKSYSGSEQWATLVDLNSCKTLWESRPNIGVSVDKKTVNITTDCGDCEETGQYDKACECQSAEVWKLGANCNLALDKKASMALTKDLLHVAFFGKKKVIKAKSPGALIVE